MIRLVLGAATSKTSVENGGHVKALLLTVCGYIHAASSRLENLHQEETNGARL